MFLVLFIFRVYNVVAGIVGLIVVIVKEKIEIVL